MCGEIGPKLGDILKNWKIKDGSCYIRRELNTMEMKSLRPRAAVNICGKVTRVLVKGSIEVYPIPGYGAVEIGLHRFINHEESETPSKPDKFIMIWRQTGNGWQITRVISLH